MSKLVKIADYHVPAYAMSALVNGDTSGISEEDEQNITKWLEKEFPDHDCLTFDYGDCEQGFNHYPAFGLPCDTVTCQIFGHAKD